MTGREYLENIRANLELGRHQHRMGESLLRAFGKIRRSPTAIDEINATLVSLGLTANPPVHRDMPLRAPRIRFSLSLEDGAATPNAGCAPESQDTNGFDYPLQDPEEQDVEEQDAEEDIGSLPEPAFSISELTSAKTDVKWVSPSASIQTAYTTMLLHKYSQLVVADQPEPMRHDIKGIVSFQSIAKALMDGNPKTVGDCIHDDVPFARSDADLKSVVSQLSGNDVVLVYGQNNRLQGIVTAWDLAEEFAELVDPFKRIGEIEERLRTLLTRRLGPDKVAEFLRDQRPSSNDQIARLEELTMGELKRVLEFPEHWDALGLAFDRAVFIKALDEAREYRNRLMHFRDPLSPAEMTRLTNFCDTVREIQL